MCRACMTTTHIIRFCVYIYTCRRMYVYMYVCRYVCVYIDLDGGRRKVDTNMHNMHNDDGHYQCFFV